MSIQKFIIYATYIITVTILIPETPHSILDLFRHIIGLSSILTHIYKYCESVYISLSFIPLDLRRKVMPDIGQSETFEPRSLLFRQTKV